MNNTLTTAEASKLSTLESTIEAGRKAFEAVGIALSTIRDSRLYRQTHGTFEDYCREKWGWSKSQSNRLIDSAEVIGNLTPIGVKPATESQARPLAKLDTPEQQQAAWDLAGEIAAEEDKPVTARHVEKAAQAVADAVSESEPSDDGVIPPPPKTKEKIKAAAKKKVEEEPPEEDFGGPTLVQELEDCHKDNLALQSLVESLTQTDAAREIKTWKGKYDAVNGRVNQLLETAEQMKKTLTYQGGLLANIRKKLGVEKNSQIMGALP